MTYIRYIILLVLLLGYGLSLSAQQIKKVSIEYTYHAPEHISPLDARRIALERAKLQAIADEFGTVVQRTNTTMMENNNGKSSIDMFSFSESDVRGEWIETTGEPEYTMSYEQNMLVVKVKVSGRVREIISAAIDLKTKILRNGTEDRFESDEFRNGDDLYLSFQAPRQGYLAIYLVDATRTAYCLLPYRSQTNGIYPIEANRRYIFFSTEHVPSSEAHLIDEYVLTTDRSTEHNLIYIVYSPNPFVKAIDSSQSETLPRELPFEEFGKWLSGCRKFDKDMQVIEKGIIVNK